MARNPGRVRVRRVGAPYAPRFAWFLHGFLQHVEQLVFCMVFATCGTACFLHGFCMTCGTACFLHDMWNSLFFCNMWNSLFFLHDTWNSLHVFSHGFACHVHVVQPQSAPPVFFLSGCRRSDILENLAVGGGAVPSGHLTNVPSRHGAERAPN